MAKALPEALGKNIKRVNVFLGALGSGKTTVVLNAAWQTAASGKKTILVDLDVINPYFRARMVGREFVGSGVKVICPPREMALGDLPALPAAIRGALLSDGPVFFDVGGDSAGATVLGSYQPYLPEADCCLFFIVNTRRPFTETPEQVVSAVRDVEDAARLKIDCLVNNTNLGLQTRIAHVEEGLKIVQAAAAELKVSVAFSSVREDLFETAKDIEGDILPVKMFLRPPWL